jgi:cytochrome c2
MIRVKKRQLLLALMLLSSLLAAFGAWIALKQHSVSPVIANAPAIPNGPAVPERLYSSLYMMDKSRYAKIPTLPDVDGGAIERLHDGFVVVTGDGQFYQLDWSKTDGNLVFTKLPLASPLIDRDAFYGTGERRHRRFRVTDLSIKPSTLGYDVYVSHMVWDREADCFRMGLSRARLPSPTEQAAEAHNTWTNIYRTQPCITQPFDTVETGGRLAWVGPDKILMTLGDHGRDGRNGPALSQDPKADYGKVLLIDTRGGAEVFTSGNRNPQGLLIDKTGQVWSTEHGPAGGDELNLLSAGNNYGWPLATYGTDYDQFTWPLNPDGRTHGTFTEPVFAFLPSVTISNLIQLGGKQFPHWEDDFLVGSLKMQTLYRIRTSENRVVYVEPIVLGSTIRDLVEASDGRVLVWSDDEAVTVLSRHDVSGRGEVVFLKCRRCHDAFGNAVAIAPNLTGVFGRMIASRPDYAYSQALRTVGGAWTEDRLLAFLADPQAFAPGTSMGAMGVQNPVDRAALVDFLKTYGVSNP